SRLGTPGSGAPMIILLSLLLLRDSSFTGVVTCSADTMVIVLGESHSWEDVFGTRANVVRGAINEQNEKALAEGAETLRKLINDIIARTVADEFSITITPDEVADLVPDDILRNDEALTDYIELHTAIPRASLRVLLGDGVEEVYEELLSRYAENGITLPGFRRYLRLFNTRERTDSALSYYSDRAAVRERERTKFESIALRMELREWKSLNADRVREVEALRESVLATVKVCDEDVARALAEMEKAHAH
ncbi:MAG: hypothetical protein ACREQV_21740, partial [Candidatus Binatia bacterium]